MPQAGSLHTHTRLHSLVSSGLVSLETSPWLVEGCPLATSSLGCLCVMVSVVNFIDLESLGDGTEHTYRGLSCLC